MLTEIGAMFSYIVYSEQCLLSTTCIALFHCEIVLFVTVSKEFGSSLADMVVGSGATLVSVGYDLCPHGKCALVRHVSLNSFIFARWRIQDVGNRAGVSQTRYRTGKLTTVFKTIKSLHHLLHVGSSVPL